MVDDGLDDSILDLPVMQVDADFVTDLKFAFWILGWHARECTTMVGEFSRVGGNRVGSGVAPAVLPHHRTCGSASGGS